MDFISSPINVIRESIATVTQILAGREIRVTQKGLKAFVEYDVDGTPISVNLPYLPDDSSDDLIFAVQGFLDHEVGHLLFTDQYEALAIAHDSQLSEMLNILEDPFVERKMRERFPGSAHNLSRLYDFFIRKIVDPNFQRLVDNPDTTHTQYFGALLPVIVRAWAEFPFFQQYMDDKWDFVEPIVSKIPDSIIAKIPTSESTKQNLELSRKILFEILRVPDDDLSEAPDEEESVSSEDSSIDEKESDGDAKSDIKDEEGSDEEGSDEEGSDDSDDSEGDDSDDSEGDDTSDIDSTDKSESDDTSTDGKASTTKTEDDESESEGEDKSDSSEEWSLGEDESLFDESLGDLETSISAEIEREARDVIAASDYSIYSADYDEISSLKVKDCPDIDRGVLDMDKECSDLVGSMINDLEKAFVAENVSYWRSSQRSGRINASSLARLRVGDTRVFKRKVSHATKDHDVQLLIDCSGSMGGSRIRLAILSAYALGKALDVIGINFEIIGFTTKHSSEMEKIDREDRTMFARTEALYMPIFKSFQENWSPEVYRRLAHYYISRGSMKQNVDGECLIIAAKRLARQPSKGKALIVLSDGEPACPGDYDAQQEHLKKAARQIESTPIKLIAVGIETYSVEEFYSNCVVINDINDVPSTLLSYIRDIVLQH